MRNIQAKQPGNALKRSSHLLCVRHKPRAHTHRNYCHVTTPVPQGVMIGCANDSVAIISELPSPPHPRIQRLLSL